MNKIKILETIADNLTRVDCFYLGFVTGIVALIAVEWLISPLFH